MIRTFFCTILVTISAISSLYSQHVYTLDLDSPYENGYWVGAATPNDLLVLSYDSIYNPNNASLLVLDSNGNEKHLWHLENQGSLHQFDRYMTKAEGDFLYLGVRTFGGLSPNPDSIGYGIHKINFRTGQLVASRTVLYPDLYFLYPLFLDIDKQGDLIIAGYGELPPPPLAYNEKSLFLAKLDHNLNTISEGFGWVLGYPVDGARGVLATRDGGFLLISSSPSAPVYSVSLPEISKFDSLMNLEWTFAIDNNPGGFPSTWGHPEVFYETDTSYQFHFDLPGSMLLSLDKSGYPNWAKDDVVIWEYNNYLWDGTDVFVQGQLTYFSRKGDGTFNYNRSSLFPFGFVDTKWIAPIGKNQLAILGVPQTTSDLYLMIENKFDSAHCSMSRVGNSPNPISIALPQYERTTTPINTAAHPNVVSSAPAFVITPDTHNLQLYCGCKPPTVDFEASMNQLTTTFSNNSSLHNSPTWHWDFGDGDTSNLENPVHTYSQNGSYLVCLTVTNYCGTTTVCDTVNIVMLGLRASSNLQVDFFPNPVNDVLNIQFAEQIQGSLKVEVVNSLGELVYRRKDVFPNTDKWRVDVSQFSNGIYFLRIDGEEKTFQSSLIVRH